jgi:hypothetical protein
MLLLGEDDEENEQAHSFYIRRRSIMSNRHNGRNQLPLPGWVPYTSQWTRPIEDEIKPHNDSHVDSDAIKTQQTRPTPPPSPIKRWSNFSI